MFTTDRDDDWEFYTIRPDGTGLRRLTNSPGNDAHSIWSDDGEWVVFSSGRKGFKDEMALYDGVPQPYGEIFAMRADGSDVRQLTDNKWEDASPGWMPELPKSKRGHNRHSEDRQVLGENERKGAAMRKVFHFDAPREKYYCDAAVVWCFDNRFELGFRKFLKRRGVIEFRSQSRSPAGPSAWHRPSMSPNANSCWNRSANPFACTARAA